jgi:hypothetical protein
MESRTNVGKDGKDGKEAKKKKTTKQKVLTIYKKADEKAAKTYAEDKSKADRYTKQHKSKVKTFATTDPDLQKKGKLSTRDLAASGAYAGNKQSDNEAKRVEGLKQTGYYDAKPAVVGGTKKMLVKSKKNVKKSQASPQAKKAARKLY